MKLIPIIFLLIITLAGGPKKLKVKIKKTHGNGAAQAWKGNKINKTIDVTVTKHGYEYADTVNHVIIARFIDPDDCEIVK